MFIWAMKPIYCTASRWYSTHDDIYPRDRSSVSRCPQQANKRQSKEQNHDQRMPGSVLCPSARSARAF